MSKLTAQHLASYPEINSAQTFISIVDNPECKRMRGGHKLITE